MTSDSIRFQDGAGYQRYYTWAFGAGLPARLSWIG